MTDARERMAAVLYKARHGNGLLTFSRRAEARKLRYLKDADAILTTLPE